MTRSPKPSPDRQGETFDADRVRFVLVEPRAAGNIGAAARALKNLGFSRLALVRPVGDPLSADARRMAVDAADLLAAATLHDDLDDALVGAQRTVGTTGRTGRQRRPHHRIDAFAEELARHAHEGPLAIVFGREDRGLTDDELDRCTDLVRLPSSPELPSFNLAQSVLLVAWELRRAALPSEPADTPPPADHETREAMLEHLRLALLTIGFLRDETAPSMMRKLRRMLGRAGMTRDEATILRGIAQQVLWAAGRAGLKPPSDP